MKYYKLHVVLGNNSADLDSCIGSILLSYYMNTIQKENIVERNIYNIY